MPHKVCLRILLRSLVLILPIILLAACTHDKDYGPAPLDSKEALEKLAKAYRKQSDSIPVSPTGLTPEARYRFLELTFHEAGYDYAATLIALSKVKKGDFNKNLKDLKQLLYLPIFDNRLKHLSDIYNKKEIAAIKTIDRNSN